MYLKILVIIKYKKSLHTLRRTKFEKIQRLAKALVVFELIIAINKKKNRPKKLI